MVSPEHTNWIYGLTHENHFFPQPVCVPSWPPVQDALTGSFSNPPSAERDGSHADSDGHKESGSKKRGRADPCSGTSSKACREKLRRDKLNDKFVELASILEPKRPLKVDKAAILVDAVRMVTQLKNEAQKLKDSNSDLQEKITELKSEKNELREEKQRLKSEKEKLEQQLNSMNTQPSFMAHPPAIPAAYPAAVSATQSQVTGSKLVPVFSYPGMAMWQFMPPADVDTSLDHELHPPVA
uniref:transcription factor ILR3-like n=1 Tax=Erigeron canadensis TaxID=72917 RepID=UPI001CB8E4E6|nr:transcription factor ILR3-like [Erigeron canadensis]